MKLKNLMLIGLSFVLVAAIAIGGTLAYLTSEDSDINVMTLGNVSIEQHEYERALNEDGTYKTADIDGVNSYVLQEFTQAKPLLPIVGDPNESNDNPAYAGWDNTVVRMTQVDSYGSMQVFAGKNAQDKFVTVKNTGKSDAYVRTLVAIECGTGNPALIGTGDRCVAADQAASSTMPWIEYQIGKIVIDNNTYLLFEYVYRGASDVNRHVNGILPAGDTSYPSLSQVYLKHNATNEDMEAIDGNGNGTLDILVISQAVQSEGFADAETALDAAFGDITTTNHPWTDGVKLPVIVDADNIDSVLADGSDVILGEDVIKPANNSSAYGKTAITVSAGQTLDGAKHSFAANGATGTWDSAINATGGTIKNITISKGFRGIFINHNAPADKCGLVTLKNVTIDGPTYTISCDQGTGNGLEAYSCKINGWTSYAATIGKVKFVETSFGKGAGYAFCRPYAPTEFVNCNFAKGYEIDPRAAVTFENCTIDGVALTSSNLSTLVTSRIENATVK